MKFIPLRFATHGTIAAAIIALAACNDDVRASSRSSDAGTNKATANNQVAAADAKQPAAAPLAATRALDPELAPQAVQPGDRVGSTEVPSGGNAPVPSPELTQPMPNSSPLEAIKNASFEQKSELVATVATAMTQFEASIAATRGGAAKPEFADRRSELVASLENAKDVLAQKRDALQYASAETWQSSKAEFRTAWSSAVEAYGKLKAATY